MCQRIVCAISTLVIISSLILSGCSRCRGPQETFKASSVRNASCCNTIAAEKINFLTLRRNPPAEYILDAGDTLGVYVQGITGDSDTPPPVHFPEDASMQPALGYPVPIRDDGYISLPLIPPVRLTGMTLGQAEARIRDAYTKDRKILLEGNDKIIVTLMKRRTYNVLVIREDLSDNRSYSLRSNETFIDDNMQGQTSSIDLPAYENDVLHALSETGGMPGENARNEIFVIRGAMNDPNFDAGGIIQVIGDSSPQGRTESPLLTGANVIRIPIEASPGEMPILSEADITLEDGDVVYIEGRERDVFYTGGLLDGGRFPLPRDYEIDVLEAISLAGGTVSTSAGSQGQGLRGGGILPATKLLVIRKDNCQQCVIEVDLRCAVSNPSERVIVQPGDMLVLEYRQGELITNSIAQIFQFGGIFRLFD